MIKRRPSLSDLKRSLARYRKKLRDEINYPGRENQIKWYISELKKDIARLERRRNPRATQIDHKSYPRRLRKKSEAELRYIIKDAKAAIKAYPGGHKAGYYADEIHYAAMELAKRKRRKR